ncbi:WD40-repeat-containing domain protein [Sparassis latifolia]
MSSPVRLAICTIQADFPDVINDVRTAAVPDGAFWLSCYKTGEPSVHANVHAALDDHDRDLVRLSPSHDVRLSWQAEYSAACPALDLPDTPLIIPIQSYPDPSPSDPRRAHKITAFDVAPDRSQLATAYSDGTIYLRRTSPLSSSAPSPRPYARAKPHLSTPTVLRFFPSSRVLLTAGLDFALTILPADPPPPSTPAQPAPTRLSPVRTLKGHTRAVTATAIVGRGRTVLSASRDGTLRLWDVPSAAQIRALPSAGGACVPILALTVGARQGEGDGEGDADVDPREVETSDKLAFLALADGSFEAHDLRTKRPILRVPSTAPLPACALQAIAYDAPRAALATGDAHGVVRIYDVRAGDARPLAAVQRNTAGIEDLAWLPSPSPPRSPSPSSRSRSPSPASFPHPHPNGITSAAAALTLAVAPADGLAYLLTLGHGGAVPGARAELVGADCEAVSCVRAFPAEEGGGAEVWSAAADGVVRRYAV